MKTCIKVRVQSEDGQIFEMDMEVIRCSYLIIKQVAFLADHKRKAGDPILLRCKAVKGTTLELLTEWIKHELESVKGNVGDTEVFKLPDLTDWDLKFLKRVDLYMLCDLAEAAHIFGFHLLHCKCYEMVGKRMDNYIKWKKARILASTAVGNGASRAANTKERKK